MKKIIFIIIGFLIVLGAVIILTIPKTKADDTVNIGYFNETIAELNERLDNQQDQINAQTETITNLNNTIEEQNKKINNQNIKLDNQAKEITTIKNNLIKTTNDIQIELDDLDFKIRRMLPYRLN